MLQKHDQLLKATAKATHALLTLGNLDEAISTALKVIGEGIGCDFISVLENVFESSSRLPNYCNFIYEWSAPGFSPLAAVFGSKRIAAESLGLTFLELYFLEGDGFGGLLEKWDEPWRNALAATQVQSAYAVPIRVNGQWWGVLAVDYCRVAVLNSPAEMAVFRTIADCIGSAIQRDRITREQKESAQKRATELAKANYALKQTVDLLATEPDLDRFLGHVLKVIADQLEAPLIQYWEHPEPGNISYLKISCSNGKILTVADLPKDCFVTGIQIPPELIGNENLHTRKRHYVVEDVPTDPIQQAIFSPLNFDLETWCTELGIRKLISMPLIRAEKTTGALLLYFPSDHQLSEQQIELAYALAQQVTLAIQLTQLAEIKQAEAIARAQEQIAQERAAELAKANNVLKQSLNYLTQESDLEAFLGHITIEIMRQVQAFSGYIFLLEDTANLLELRIRVQNGCVDYQAHSTDPELFHSPFPADMTPLFQILCQNQQISSLNGQEFNGLVWPGTLEWFQREGFTAALCLALIAGKQPVGLLILTFSDKTMLKVEEIELIHALAHQITLAIQLTRLAEEAQQAALLQERTRMAREIHDTLAQAFGGISMQLQAVNYFATTQPDKAQAHLLTAQALAKDGLAEARRSVWTLYLETTEYEDPARTIARFIEQTTSGQLVPIRLAIDGSPYHLHPDLGLNLLRIAQESITNALRHAEAQTIHIRLCYDPQTLRLIIHDDGRGFEPQLPIRGFGLSGMQQRAARFGATWQLVSQPGQGTTITVTIANPTSF